MNKIQLFVIEYDNEDAVFATRFDGVVTGDIFYGMKSSSVSDLIPDECILKVSMTGLRIDSNAICYVGVSADTPLADGRFEVIGKDAINATVYSAIRSCFK